MSTGTLGPIRVSCGDDQPLQVGKDYFLVQLVAAQAFIEEGLFKQWFAPASHLLITSDVSLDAGGAERLKLEGFQASRPIASGEIVVMAIERNVLHLSPARAASFQLVFSFFVTSDSRISAFSDIVKDDPALRAAFGLAPAQIAIAQAVSGLVGKVINVFLKDKDRKPLLQFEGDFNLPAGDVLPGYYLFVSNAGVPGELLPDDSRTLSFDGTRMNIAGQHIDNLSYAVLSLKRVAIRGLAASADSAWSAKLREADDLALQAELLRGDKQELDALRDKVRKLVLDAQALLRDDRRYHDWEASAIIRDAVARTGEQLSKGETVPLTRKLGAMEDPKQAWIQEFHFTPGDEFHRTVQDYRQQLAAMSEAR